MKKVLHIVLIKFKTPGKVEGFLAEVAEMKKHIPEIESYEFGEYSSPEGLNQGLTHGFVITFTNAAARDRYLTHPAHEAIVKEYLPHVANVIAFDFEA
jgi:hypothetical protein